MYKRQDEHRGDSFKAQATNTTDYNFTVTAARGDIVDSAGRRIAASTTSYNVVLSKLLMGDEDLDTMLQKVVDLLEAHGERWNDSLLIGEPDAAGHYSFTAQADSTSDQKALAAMKDSLGLQQYATADDVMEKLVEDYKLENYSLHWQRVLGGIHYEMQQQAFSNINNFVMAENVSETTVATIKENSLTLPGVEIVETSTRSYEQGDILPAVLGRVGKITRINTPLIEDLVADDYIPIIASIAIGEDGGCYNVNADVAAGYIAAAIGAHKIIFLTDVDGLYENYPDPDSLIAEMSLGEAEAMVRGDKLASGMIPKLASCVRALDSGVSAAHIINGTVPHALLLEMLTDSGMGTMVGGLASAQFLNVSPVSKFAAKLIENR